MKLTEEMTNILNKQRNKKGPYIIFEVQGGLGKSCMSIGVINAIKKQYPEYNIVVVSAYEAPFYYNPDIYRVYTFGNMSYFYDDYMFDDTIVMRIDPYHTDDHIHQRKHLIQTWTDMYGIKYNNEQPKIYLNPREIEIARDKIKPDSGKPIMLLQTHGGAPGQYSKKSWMRDLPISQAQKLADYYSKSYRILHIRREDQPVLNNVEPLTLPHRELFAVFTFSKKRIFIDSFSQHVAKALGLDSVVCWIGNKPEVFGYKNNINILPKAKKINEFNKFSYVEQYDISGQIQQFPYDTVNVFDIEEIIEAVKKT